MPRKRNPALVFFIAGVAVLGWLTSRAADPSPRPSSPSPSPTPHRARTSAAKPRVGSPAPVDDQAKADGKATGADIQRFDDPRAGTIRPDEADAPGMRGGFGEAEAARSPQTAVSWNGDSPGPVDVRAGSTVNEEVIDAIRTMPQGGGYKASGVAFTQLQHSVSIDPAGRLAVRAQLAKPSFCSGATFLVFLAVLERMDREGRLRLSPEASRALLVHGQPDGTGVWGRWNANGPGTARLFYESGLGRNFTSFEEARPGDFMKVWWNDNIGSTEHGHSVVYLGTSVGERGEPTVSFWSSNVPGGFGVRTVAKSEIKRALFSRLENVAAINRVEALPTSDFYLAAMLRRPSSESEMFKLVGVPAGREVRDRADGPRPSVVAAIPSEMPRAAEPAAAVPATVTTLDPPDMRGRTGVPAGEPTPAVAASRDSNAGRTSGVKTRPAPAASPTPSPTPKPGLLKRMFGG